MPDGPGIVCRTTMNNAQLILFENVLKTIYPVAEAAVRRLALNFSCSEVQKGFHFARQGQPNTLIAFVHCGIFRSYFTTEDGREYIKYFLMDNDVLFSGTDIELESHVSIEALGASLIFVGKYCDFIASCSDHSDLNEMKNALFEKSRIRKELREMSLLSSNARENYKLFKKQYPDIENRVTQYHIAGYLGITPSQLSRLKNLI